MYIKSQFGQITRFIRTAALLLVLLLSSVTGIAAAQETDPAEELVTPINMQQTIDGVTVTLKWAYADNNRIALGTHITAEDETWLLSFPHAWLTDDAGHVFWSKFGGGGAALGANRLDASVNFTMALPDTPTEFNLKLELATTVEIIDPASNALPGGGGGGYAGGGPVPPITDNCHAYPVQPMVKMADDYPTNMWLDDMAWILDEGEEIVGPFVFEFTVPFTPGMVKVTPEQTVEANDLGLTLETVVFTPSMAQLVIYGDQAPDEVDALFRSLGIELQAGAAQRMATGTEIAHGERAFCINIDIPIPYGEEAETWQFTITPATGEPWSFEFAAPDLTE